MFFNQKLEDCYETVIAALASQIESQQSELDFKQRKINQLELQLEDAKIKLAAKQSNTPASSTIRITPQEWANAFGSTLSDSVARAQLDSDKDPFEEDKPNE